MATPCGLEEDDFVVSQHARHEQSSSAAAVKTTKAKGSWARAAVTLGEEQVGTGTAAPAGRARCMKCKERDAVVLVRSGEPVCHPCLDISVVTKVRTAKGRGAFLTREKVVVALSGGSSCMSMLACIMELQSKHPSRLEKGKVHIDLFPVHIEEGAAWGLAADSPQAQHHHQQLREAVAAAGCDVPLQIIPLSRVLVSHGDDQSTPASSKSAEAELFRLVQSVKDMTGREDLVVHLRNQLLLDVARQVGATKIAKGDNANTLAIKVISDTTKGRGFSIPSEIQLADGRHGPGQPATVLPMRDVTAKETVWFCRGRHIAAPLVLPVLPPEDEDPRMSLNQLAEGFVAGMQANLPSIMFTIMRTAGALKPFPFNDTDTANNDCGAAALSATMKRKAGRPPTSTTAAANYEQERDASAQGPQQRSAAASQRLCALCYAPIPSTSQQYTASLHAAQEEDISSSTSNTATTSDRDVADIASRRGNLLQDLHAACCTSCSGQIIGNLGTGSQQDSSRVHVEQVAGGEAQVDVDRLRSGFEQLGFTLPPCLLQNLVINK